MKKYFSLIKNVQMFYTKQVSTYNVEAVANQVKPQQSVSKVTSVLGGVVLGLAGILAGIFGNTAAAQTTSTVQNTQQTATVTDVNDSIIINNDHFYTINKLDGSQLKIGLRNTQGKNDSFDKIEIYTAGDGTSIGLRVIGVGQYRLMGTDHNSNKFEKDRYCVMFEPTSFIQTATGERTPFPEGCISLMFDPNVVKFFDKLRQSPKNQAFSSNLSIPKNLNINPALIYL